VILLILGALATTNLYLWWVGYPSTTWISFANSTVAEWLLAPAEWFVAHWPHPPTAVPVPTDLDMPILSCVRYKTCDRHPVLTSPRESPPLTAPHSQDGASSHEGRE